MIVRRRSARAVRTALTLAVALLLPACAAGATAHLSTFHAPAKRSTVAINKSKLLHPKHKYYGVFTPSAPASMQSITTITNETGKQPNLDLFFQAWDSDAAAGTANKGLVHDAENACAAGVLPMLTWESWNTSVQGDDRGVTAAAWAQRAFSPAKITAGKYDKYIRASARAMASIGCPIALRFDQEFDGYWYPWGEGTDGMPGTPAVRAKRYIAMWRHVWTIFQHQHATNVLWVWSPNIQKVKHKGYPDLSTAYPGNKYVDWIGLDGYYYNPDPNAPSQTFKSIFGPTMDQLSTFVKNKPWLIAETGVGTGAHKPSEITNLLHAVARDKQFNGLVYFDEYKPNDRSDWRFDGKGDSASLNAFKTGIDSPTYAAGKPGSL